jgi:hypothetical protein
MAKMRGVDPFSALWDRRTTVEIGGESFDLLSLPDLVAAKKTQRDKDWPMLSRLVEANYFAHRDSPVPEQIAFWLRELRNPSLLIEVASRFPAERELAAAARPLLALAGEGKEDALRAALREEEEREREADRRYWKPLKEELRRLRCERRPR